MPDSAEEFDTLMMRVRLGEEEALSQLVQQYEQEVRRAASCLLGRALRAYLDPADLVQSVHRTLIQGLREHTLDFDSPQKLLALARTLLRHKAVERAREWQCHQRHSQALAETKMFDQTRTSAERLEADPALVAEHKDAIDYVCRNVDETGRRLLLLHLQGYSTAEAARELEMDPDVLRVRLSRLRQRLRENPQLADWLI